MSDVMSRPDSASVDTGSLAPHDGTTHDRLAWEMPALTRLPPLTELTLVTGPAIHGGGGTGGSGSTVF
ncbi:MAG: hypothetical protein JWM95_3894 [Gemmatimonadetes bacterium]|nr:hypothetical protein [Gemmatimonadota bacterium]